MKEERIKEIVELNLDGLKYADLKAKLHDKFEKPFHEELKEVLKNIKEVDMLSESVMFGEKVKTKKSLISKVSSKNKKLNKNVVSFVVDKKIKKKGSWDKFAEEFVELEKV